MVYKDSLYCALGWNFYVWNIAPTSAWKFGKQGASTGKPLGMMYCVYGSQIIRFMPYRLDKELL